MKKFYYIAVIAVFLWGSAGATPNPKNLKLASNNALILELGATSPLYEKKADSPTPIASLTKLMTAMIVLDSGLSLKEEIDVGREDLDYVKGSHSRLRLGTWLTRGEMLRLALMSSENHAAAALARHYPGGRTAFVVEMNAKAHQLGLKQTSFSDSTGLSPENVSTAQDLATLVQAATRYPLIREYTTTPEYSVELSPTGRKLEFQNSNRLVRAHNGWDISLQKTGYINEAGRCLVMITRIAQKDFVIVLLDSVGKYTRLGDAKRVKTWIETGKSGDLPKIITGDKKTSDATTVKPTTPAKKTKKKKAKH
ncbi:MAG: D-alanyl-D-alanine endopeptidase [Betaproteobacteria bacterium]|nr:D-alanyl-D-alanine endopeptidase [Betaproteobacteria bacterium]